MQRWVSQTIRLRLGDQQINVERLEATPIHDRFTLIARASSSITRVMSGKKRQAVCGRPNWNGARILGKVCLVVLLLVLGILQEKIAMAHQILSETAASISELKRNPMGTVAAGEGFPVAILNRNEPAFYCVPAKAFEAMIERLEDIELNALADARAGEQHVKIKLDEL